MNLTTENFSDFFKTFLEASTNVNIPDLPAISGTNSGDLFEVYQIDDVNRKISLAELQTALAAVTQTRYVSQDGSDSSDAGTAVKPYATIEYALSQITDASPTKLYKLVCTGYFTGVTLTLLPSIIYDFTGAFLDYSGFMDLDPSFDTTANGRADVIGGRFRFPGSLSFTLSGADNKNTVTFYASDFADTQTIDVIQDSGGANQCVVVFVDCVALPDGANNPPVAGPNFYVENATFIHRNSSAASITVINNSTAAQSEAVVHSCVNKTCGYEFSSNESAPLNVDMEASPILSGLVLDGDTVALSIDTASYSDNISYTNGATSAQITFKNEAGGLEAGFVPSYYTPTTTQVKGHLQGLDAAVAGVTSLGAILTGGGTYTLTYPLSPVYWVQDAGQIILPDATDPLALSSPKSIVIFSPQVSATNVFDNLGSLIGSIPYFSGYQFTNFSNSIAEGDWRTVEIALSIPVLSQILFQKYSFLLTTDFTFGFGGFGDSYPVVFKDPSILTDITLTINMDGSSTGFTIPVHNFKGNTGAIIVTLTGSGSPTFDNDGVTTSITLNPGDGLSITSVNQGGIVAAAIDYIYRAQSVMLFSTDWSGPYASPVAGNTSYITTERTVSFTLPGLSSASTISAPITADTILPINIRPANNKRFVISVGDNSSRVIGVALVGADGSFTVYSGIAENNFVSSGNAGFANTTLTWDLFA